MGVQYVVLDRAPVISSVLGVSCRVGDSAAGDCFAADAGGEAVAGAEDFVGVLTAALELALEVMAALETKVLEEEPLTSLLEAEDCSWEFILLLLSSPVLLGDEVFE